MSSEIRDDAADLVASLRAALAVFEEQLQRAEALRARAGRSHERLSEFLRLGLEGADPAETRRHRQQWFEEMRREFGRGSGWEDMRASRALSRRWSTAFCDAYEALMRVYPCVEAQERARQVAATLRSIRLLEVDIPVPEPPEFPKPDINLAEHTREAEAGVSPAPERLAAGGERTSTQRFEMARDFFQRMDPYHERVLEELNERSARTGELLREALRQAEALAGELPA